MSVYVLELAKELGERGHWIDIHTGVPSQKAAPVVELHPNVRLVHLSANTNGHSHKFGLHEYVPDYLRALEGFRASQGIRYDLIHSHYWLSGLVGACARALWDVPHVLMFHTLGAVKNTTGCGKDEPALRVARERELAGRCDRIVAPTERERDNLIRYCDATPGKISVIPCGVNLNRFRPVDQAHARKRLGLSPDESIILYVGRFAPLKGIDRLLAAAPRVRHRKKRLILVGGDGANASASRSLQKMARQLGIDETVALVGRVEHRELPLYYSAADVLVVASHYESFGLVALEALACGTPVVATPVGAMEELVMDGVTGEVVADPTPISLAAGIDAVLSRARSTRLSPEFIRSSVVKHGWSRVASAIVGEYTGALRQRSQARSSDACRPCLAQ